jgi:SAM-dependent methyltransferase
MSRRTDGLIFGITVFSSSFLLFLIQPIVSKYILPWYGGTSAVWTTCMVFFQVILLLGYAYSDWVSRSLRPPVQLALHGGLIILSLVTLKILADAGDKPDGLQDPTLSILILLVSTIGLPYFLLSTTGPLIQSWASRAGAGPEVYRYFSLSNLSSLAALLSYPFLIEPNSTMARQASVWSMVYFVFAAFCLLAGIRFSLTADRHAPRQADASMVMTTEVASAPPTLSQQMLWIALSGMGSWLLLAVTNHLTQNIAPVPLLWLLPLCIYLVTFTMAFESDRWYARKGYLPVMLVLVVACAFGLQSSSWPDTKTGIPLYLIGLFFVCMFLHGELASRRPATRHLTRFYLMISLGGALGGITVGLLAPRFFVGYYELGLGFVIVLLLAMGLTRRQPVSLMVTAAGALACSVFLSLQVIGDTADARVLKRNFYGTLHTNDAGIKGGPDETRQLYHGSVNHGEQYLSLQRRNEPTKYYGRSSGVGLAIENATNGPRRLGLIGLGTGTLAVYGRDGDYLRFYEINPEVVKVAKTEFTFIADSRAKVDVVLGDARLVLEQEAANEFDVLAIDAFSGDSVPVHLITVQAVELYLKHLKPDGMLAFHVTNRFLSLAPVLERISARLGLHCVLIHDVAAGTDLYRTDWVLMARTPQVLSPKAIQDAVSPIERIQGLSAWTDDFNNLVKVLK